MLSKSIIQQITAATIAAFCIVATSVHAQQTPPTPTAPPAPTDTPNTSTDYGTTPKNADGTPMAPPPPPPLPYVQTYDAAHPPDAILDPMQGPGGPTEPWAQAALQFGVPMFLSNAKNALTAGYSFVGRFGWHVGNLVPELQLGYMSNDYDNDVSAFNTSGSSSNSFFGFGARLLVPTRSVIMPFVAGHLNFNFWNSDYWNSHFAPGFDAEGGMLFRVHPVVAIEASVRVGQTFPGNYFVSPYGGSQFWISPQLGATFFFY